ncbi:MAG: hypothetical protein ACOYX1_14080 [Acidobacteriota bacterium]
MIVFALALLWQSGFAFSEVRPWRWSDGRGEFIPALTAVLDNQTGQDYAMARFLVRVRCEGGGVREYPVLLQDVLMGRQRVEVTAYDSIGSVSYCPGTPEVVPLDSVPYSGQQRPAFVVFGFSRRNPGQAVSTDLEGILDYRRHSDTHQTIEFRPWRRHGARFTLPGIPDMAFYMIRVVPGRVGLAGFVVEASPEPRNALSRFLRFYDVPPGEARFLGLFELELDGPGRASVVLTPAAGLLPELAPRIPRPLAAARAIAPPASSTVVAEP